MHALDLVAAVALAAAALLGARKGLWRMLAGGVALALGAFAGMAASGPISAALGDFGVAYPGDVLLGFFLPFALVSVYTRYIAGLWLSRRLQRRPARNRWLGAAAGAVWVVFALGFLTRVAGFGSSLDPETLDGQIPNQETGAELAAETGRVKPPFCEWLACYPGEVASRLQPEKLVVRERGRTWEEALRAAFDAERVQARAAEADREAASSIRNGLSGEEAQPPGASSGPGVAGRRRPGKPRAGPVRLSAP